MVIDHYAMADLDAVMRTEDTQILHSLKESVCSEGLAKPSNDYSHQDQGW